MTTYTYNLRLRSPWLVRLPLLAVTGALLLGAILVGLVLAVQARYADAIYPGVWAYGVNLSGMSQAQAEAALADAFVYDDRAVFTFRDGERYWQFSAADLGVRLDVEAAVAQAYAVGRGGGPAGRLLEQAQAWFAGRAVPVSIYYNQAAAAARLESIAAEVGQPPRDATLAIDGVVVTSAPGATGRALDIPAMLGQLDPLILRLDTGAELPLVIVETPPLIRDADEAAARARAAVAGAVTLVADDIQGRALGPWTIAPDQLARLLTVGLAENGDGTLRYTVDASVEHFRAFLENLAPGLATQPRDARFHFNDEARQLEVFEPGANGRVLSVDDTLLRLENAIFNPDPNARVVPVAFNYTLARYHDGLTAAELGISGLVAEGTTYYTGSTISRITNIGVAAARFDGVMIAPGEEFSFNDILGEISRERGFVEGYVIMGERTGKDVGGGVCQVSTTAFQAAFEAGYPFNEWHAHAYRVGYYERGEGLGMDAAIYQSDTPGASLDLRFVNDTPYHLLIETSVYPAEQALQFRFYSTNPGRQVVKEGPQISDVVPATATIYEANSEVGPQQELWVDWPAEGAQVVVVRRILDTNGGELRRDTFNRRYLPWSAVVQVNPSDPRLNQQNAPG